MDVYQSLERREDLKACDLLVRDVVQQILTLKEGVYLDLHPGAIYYCNKRLVIQTTTQPLPQPFQCWVSRTDYPRLAHLCALYACIVYICYPDNRNPMFLSGMKYNQLCVFQAKESGNFQPDAVRALTDLYIVINEEIEKL